MTDQQVQSIFVYGTLMRGQARERCWIFVSVAKSTEYSVLSTQH
jgi:gamma-glutamylcyclotransferase (GGCT)/AIG2-like uncharacterized protein YtfP